MQPFAWSPTLGVKDVTQFPDEDPLIREHLQTLLDQVKTYFNTNLVNAINEIKTQSKQNLIDCTNTGITYSGTWGLEPIIGRTLNGVNKTSNVVGSYIEYTFVGTGIVFYDIISTNRGIIEVFIDDISQGTVDRYSSITKYDSVGFQISGLTLTTHKIKIVVTGTKNASSSNYYVSFNNFRVLNSVFDKFDGIGYTPSLNTTIKDNLVNAINEVNVSKSPKPTTTAGALGEWRNMQTGNNTAWTLPSGGTWAYSCTAYNYPAGTAFSNYAGISAGGTTIFPATSDKLCFGFVWRIA